MSAYLSENCPFCVDTAGRMIDSNDLAFTVEDAFPVSLGHALIVSRRHVESFFDLNACEMAAILSLLHRAKERLEERNRPNGYNIGVNIGSAAGQTVMHVHVHLIPRHTGDVAEPEGGVRNVIPSKGRYLPQGLAQDDNG
jgi:diadenosine tetraphosphate (Ap4A) HIT family hydrolase